MNAVSLVVLALAVWRLSSLVVHERGPFDVFQRARARVGFQHDADGHVTAAPETLIGGILGCLWCASIYVGAIATLCAFLWPDVAFWLALPFALSAAAIGFERMVKA